MIDNIMRQQFETWVETASAPIDTHPEYVIPVLMTVAAFTHPIDQLPIFTAIEQALSASDDVAEQARHIAANLEWVTQDSPPTPLPRPLWEGFWDIVQRPQESFTTELDLTLAVVALGELYDRRIIDECEKALLQFDSVKKLLAQPEIRLKTSDLQHRAQDSLATELLEMLTRNGYDIEVIDADTVLLDGDYPAQNRTNRRILQLHDIWHLVGGYGFTGAGEVAISGFQLAQFGQNYSTRFLATIATKAAFAVPEFVPMLLTVMFDGWRHGCAASPLIDAPWHELIGDPIPAIRDRYDIQALNSPMVTLMEQMSLMGAK
jgi:ubiquinone biosynthesis protein Coq4